MASNDTKDSNSSQSKLSWKQRRFLALLGFPVFGVSLAYTMATTYLPHILTQLSGPAVTGLIIGAEGIFALLVPLIVGSWSDSLRTRIGGRMPFILVGTALAVPALVAMALGQGSLFVVVIALTVFFIGYFTFYSPYYALFPDLVPEELRGRSQGAVGGFRSAGMLVSLVGGGLLLGLWQPLPFLVGAVLIAIIVGLFFFAVRRRLGEQEGEENGGGEESGHPIRRSLREEWGLVKESRDIRLWLCADTMWEAGVGALRAFVVLYFTQGLGFSLYATAGALALVGVAAIAAAPLSGELADRFGHRPVMLVAVVGFGLGCLPPLFTTNPYWLIGILPVAFAAVIVMTLPYSVLMGFLPEDEHHGAGAALSNSSRGVGIVLGAMLAGLAIEALRGVGFLTFEETGGFVAMFLVASAFLLASVPFLLRMNIESRREA